MPTPDEKPGIRQPADWAVAQAAEELPDAGDQRTIEERAWELMRDAQEREDERHDEYDDPDQGGEA